MTKTTTADDEDDRGEIPRMRPTFTVSRPPS